MPFVFAPVTSSRFPLGRAILTRGVCDKMEEDDSFTQFVQASLERHANGDWGNLSEDDRRENEFSLDKYLRLFSAYESEVLPKIWIITEADRSVTTILFPDEY